MKVFSRSACSLQVTKSVISLLEYYRWYKFTIIYEDMWETVAQSLKEQATRKNMTVNDMKSATDRHKCCENSMLCCRSGYWYRFIQDTKNRTRSTYLLIRHASIKFLLYLVLLKFIYLGYNQLLS